MRTCTIDRAESFSVRATEIVYDGLAKVIAIAQWFARNVSKTRVNRIQADAEIPGAIQASNLIAEFAVESLEDLLPFSVFGIVMIQPLVCFLQKAGTLHPRPRSHSKVRTLDITERGQALK